MQSPLKTVMSLRLTLILQSGFSTAFFHRNDNEKLCFYGIWIASVFFIFYVQLNHCFWSHRVDRQRFKEANLL